MEPHSQIVLLIFRLADRLAAFRVEDVERITPMAELARPPGLPSALEGILNLAGVAIPVFRLDRLFGLPAQRMGLYSILIVLRSRREGRLAILADQVNEIVQVSPDALRHIDRVDAFNGCAEAIITLRDDAVHVLSRDRIILAKERETLLEFQALAQRRLADWKVGQV